MRGFYAEMGRMTTMRVAAAILVVLWMHVAAEGQAGSNLPAKLRAIAASAQGTLGVAVIDVATGETVGINETDWYPMMSVYKLPIAMHVLRAAHAGRIDLSARVGQ